MPFRKSPLLAYAVLVAIAEGYRIALGALHLDATFWIFNQLPAYLDIFGAGMLAAYTFVAVRNRQSFPDRRMLTVVSAALIVAGIAVLAHVTSIDRASGMDATYAWVNAHRIVLGPLFVALAVSTAYSAAPWRAFIATRPLVFLSVISYNLYLWNLEIAVWLHDAGLSPWGSFALSIVASLGVATAITYLLERPILRATEPPRAAQCILGEEGRP